MKLSIIIVNYNVRYFLELALESVQRAAQGMDTEVFVVDNNSEDDSVEMVREKFPWVRLIANTDNPGFSIANNQAIHQSTGEYILLLNPDTVVEEDTFQKCCNFMDHHPDAGGLGARMIDGSGNFLPESKRGFPSPWVAFCKTFGLSRFFPKSPLFNQYHLGYLSEFENHKVDVLAGAFMMMRRSVLDKIGLLDETFFMYGEDIDLSYRIIKGGYQNYYFSDTKIIHYKGESTKKGSLNYVRVFYNAMIIFTQKHFTGKQASGFIVMLKMAIYFRAFLTVLGNFLKKAWFPVIDALLMAVGLYFIKDIWATNYYGDPAYYANTFYYFNIPLYIAGWIGFIFFNGGYDESFSTRRTIRGILLGTILIAAVYGFLPLDLRPSRAIILFGAIWSVIATTTWRTLVHFHKTGNFNTGENLIQNIAIIGSEKESQRALQLLGKARSDRNLVGRFSTTTLSDPTALGSLNQLPDFISIYKIDECIFCAADLSFQEILEMIDAMKDIVQYKIVPQHGDSIVGSSSKNTSGQLYTIDVHYQINTATARRNKRVFDVVLSLLMLVTFPIWIWWIKQKSKRIADCWNVFLGKKTMVGYADTPENQKLPAIQKGILSPTSTLKKQHLNAKQIAHLNFLYAKDYTVYEDWRILSKTWLKN